MFTMAISATPCARPPWRREVAARGGMAGVDMEVGCMAILS
jgi:hypothetical protein